MTWRPWSSNGRDAPRNLISTQVFGSVAHRFESEIVDPDDYNDALDPDVKRDSV